MTCDKEIKQTCYQAKNRSKIKYYTTCINNNEKKTASDMVNTIISYCYGSIFFFKSSVLTLDLNWLNSSILLSTLSLFHKVGAAYKNDGSKKLAAHVLLIGGIAKRKQS